MAEEPVVRPQRGPAATGGYREPVRCELCGSRARPLYEGLPDRLCGTPGAWRLVRCRSRRCGLVYLDPMPDRDALAEAYDDYYTHEEDRRAPDETHRPPRAWLHRASMAWLRATGLLADRRSLRLSYLDAVRPGRVLEVGCGSGWRLAELRELGWEVVGQEVDEPAAAAARRAHGLEVLVGPLAQLGLPAASFDAVVSNHVLEHVLDPEPFLRECWRLVAGGGRLVCVTPNPAGFGRRVFGRYWFGLDPPRHLRMFPPRALGAIAARSGIAISRVWTSAANTFVFATRSLDPPDAALRSGRAVSVLGIRLLGAALQHLAVAVHAAHRSSGDECVLWALK
ncbi:MAG TPA: class I SAM-dependent methyltransferase [Thermoanaerobaculaceae bacterium]|nr:class I SAM-dependent methyltransferase [Thermoanaerobaculaceae bacterium]